MPLVTMPDGTQVQMPDNPDPALLARLQAFRASKATPAAAPTSMSDNLIEGAKQYGRMVAAPWQAGAGLVAGIGGKILGDMGGLAAIPFHALDSTAVDPATVKSQTQADVQSLAPQTQESQAILNSAAGPAKAIGKATGYLGNKAGQLATSMGADPGTADVVRSGATEAADQGLNFLGEGLGALGKSVSKIPIPAQARQAMLTKLRGDGFVIPPAEFQNAPLGKALTGVAGKDQINRGFSIANDQNVSRLAGGDLGIDTATTSLDPALVERKIADAGKVYDQARAADQTLVPVKSPNGVVLKGPTGQVITKPAGPVIPDKQLEADISNIGADRANATFGTKIDPQVQELKDSLSAPESIPTSDLVDKVKDLRQQARINMKAYDDAAKQNLGRAQQQAADALESQFDRYLQPNQPGLLSGLKQARTTIAKAKTIQEAMGPDGKINPDLISRYRSSGGYVDGGLAKIADAADTIGNVVKNTEKVSPPEPFSKMQFLASLGGLTAGGGTVAGHAGAATGATVGTLLAAPSAARALLGSRAYQATLGRPGSLASLAGNPASPLAGLVTNPEDYGQQ